MLSYVMYYLYYVCVRVLCIMWYMHINNLFQNPHHHHSSYCLAFV